MQPPVPFHPSSARVPGISPGPPPPASARTTCQAAPPGSCQEAGGDNSRSRRDDSFTGEWVPHRPCQCFRSPARSAHVPGRSPDLRCSPPSWLEAEQPARRGTARTAGASSTRCQRKWAGRAWRRARASPSPDPGPGTCTRPRCWLGGRGDETRRLPLNLTACPSCCLETSLAFTYILVFCVPDPLLQK